MSDALEEIENWTCHFLVLSKWNRIAIFRTKFVSNALIISS